MPTSAQLADQLQSEINDKFGQRHNDPRKREEVMALVLDVVEAADADFTDRHESVDFFGFDEGERVDSTADIAFARFGRGKDAAWVAVIFLADGWTNAKRPFTEDTANMAWLEGYIRGELAG